MPTQNLENLKNGLASRFANDSAHAERFAAFKFSKTAVGDDVLEIPKDVIVPVVRFLKESKDFDFLMDICGVDYPERQAKGGKRFDVVYHIYSSKTYTRLRIKVELGETEAIDSVASLYKNANWYEREAFDMFGLQFRNHPHLSRLLCHHEFQGHPLRKDYDADHQQHLSHAMPAYFDADPNFKREGRSLVPLNIGPSHPSTHGTLRIMAELDGETIARSNLEIGYLHRCFEKMAETHPYNQVIPYTDRLNYCSAPMNNIGYCKTVERLLGVELPPRAQAMRVILAELSRIIDHLVCIGANAVDLGALTSFFHLFNHREMVYTLFEKLCGARLTVSMTRIGGMAQDTPPGWFDDLLDVCNKIESGIVELDTFLTGNKIWIGRTQGVGAISAQDAIEWGYTGPCLRAAGVNHDLRKINPYYGYDQLDFDVPIGSSGDVYDRYLVRVEEMRQSLRIVRQLAKNMPEGDWTIRDRGIVLPEKKDVYGNIEGLMNHFMLVIKGLRPPVGDIYDATEAANGELGFYLVSDGSGRPYRLHVRGPCFTIFQSLPEQINGGLVSDVISILGSMNIIAGELDR